MEILIDTNFAINCAKQKIDFFNLTHQITGDEIIWLFPDKVLQEVQEISKKKGVSVEDKNAALLFLDILKMHETGKTQIKNIFLKNKVVDNAIVDYCKSNPETVLATLDKKLKSRVNNRILTIKGKKFLRFTD